MWVYCERRKVKCGEEGRERGRGEAGNEGVDGGMEGKTLTRQISSECVHCVGFRWPKTTILGNF